jgi:hypothetical protein
VENVEEGWRLLAFWRAKKRRLCRWWGCRTCLSLAEMKNAFAGTKAGYLGGDGLPACAENLCFGLEPVVQVMAVF